MSKDRLYTFAANSTERRSAQTAMYLIADGLARLLAPILPVTADELWRHLPGPREASVHIAEFPPRAEVDALVDRDLVARWQRLIAHPGRREPGAGVGAPGQDHRHLARRAGRARRERRRPAPCCERYRDELPMLFIVSQVSLEATRRGRGSARPSTSRARKATSARAAGAWSTRISSSPDTDGLCDRCVDAVGGSQAA